MEIIFVFIFGAFLGSFLYVLIKRLPISESVIFSRSKCDHCGHVLGGLDLIPLFSYLFLGGKCRYCKKKLSPNYPLFEFFSAVGYALLYVAVIDGYIAYPLLYGSKILLFIYLAVILSTLVVIFFTDLSSYIIPFGVVVVGAVVSAVYLLLLGPEYFLEHLLVGVATAVFFFLIYLITLKKGIGLGDVVYAFYMGLFLGFPKIIPGLYVSFLTGAVVSIILILLRRKNLRGSIVPFGPFLVIGTVISLIFGSSLWNIFASYMGI